jgi:hypothetical protein
MRVIRIFSIVLLTAFATTLSVSAIQSGFAKSDVISLVENDKNPDNDKDKKSKKECCKEGKKYSKECSKSDCKKKDYKSCSKKGDKYTSTSKCCSSKCTKK